MHTTECYKRIPYRLTLSNCFAFLLIALILLVGSRSHALQLTWGDERTVLPYEPRLVGTTFFVPIDIVTGFGGMIEKQEGHYDVYLGTKHLRLWPDNPQFELGGSPQFAPRPAHEMGDRLWVPLRVLADHLLQAQMSFSSGTLHLAPWQPLSVTLASGSRPDDSLPSRTISQFATDEGDRVGHPIVDEPPVPSAPAVLVRDVPQESPDQQIIHEAEVETVRVLRPDVVLPMPRVDVNDSRDGVASVPMRTDVQFGNETSHPLRFVGLDRLEPPRLSVRLPHVPVLSKGMQLTAIKQTLLRAERLDWVEAEVTQTSSGKDAVHIASSKSFLYNAFVLTDPSRLVIDLVGLDTGHAHEPLLVNGPNIQGVRINQNAPEIVRIVLDLNDSVGYTIETTSDGRSLTVALHHAIRQVHTRFFTHSGTIQFDIPRETQYEVFRLGDPDRLVIDLYDTTWLRGTLPGLDEGASVRGARIQQFDPSRTRVVLEVDRHLDIALDTHQEQLTFHLGHQVRQVGYAMIPNVGLVVHVDGTDLPDPQLMYLSEPERLVIDLPGTVLAHPLNDAIINQDGVAWRIRSGQHPEMVRLVLDLNSSVEYELIRLPHEQGVAIAVLLPSLTGKRIFIDPGHGGSDPGTLGRVLGLTEKDIVLDISFRLRDMLHEAGASAVLSRETDVLIPLERRPALARQAGADLFLSVHANASTSNYEAGGTETYIYNRPNHPDNARLAGAIQRHLVSAIGLINRGVKQANFAVLRHSFIPSALVEVAFMSREEEEWLLSEPWFRERVAQGLFNGIVAYFSEGASRAANRPAEERRRLEEGITSWLAKDLFVYLAERTSESDGLVGVVQVQPL